MIECPELYRIVQAAIADCFEKNGISALNVDVRALPYTMVRNAVIRQQYYDQIVPGNSEGVREELAKKYGIKHETINEILYRKSPFK